MATTLRDEFLALLAAAGAVPVRREPSLQVTDKDVLIVVDMQHDFLPGGAFGVAEGDAAVPAIISVIEQFKAAGGRVFATRDYHPVDHCSFSTHGGPFPPHCVQNSPGSMLCDALVDPLRSANATIVFKGFSPDVDSFGGLPYEEAECGKRVTSTGTGFCGSSWTGSFVLFSSTAQASINAPPDVMSVLKRVALSDVLAQTKPDRVFVVGLALDFCVLDTACNAAKAGHRAIIVTDASRAAHIPGFGKHGSGFLSDPAEIAAKLQATGVELHALA